MKERDVKAVMKLIILNNCSSTDNYQILNIWNVPEDSRENIKEGETYLAYNLIPKYVLECTFNNFIFTLFKKLISYTKLFDAV